MEKEWSDKKVNELFDKAEKKVEKRKELEKLANTFGAVILKSDMIINIKNNFYFLERFWQTWVIAQAFGDEAQKLKILAETNGGLIDCGDVVLRLDDIKVLLRTQVYEKSSDEEKEEIDYKNSLINEHISKSISFIEDYDDDEEDDDDE